MSIWYWSAQNGYSCCELKLNKAIICKATTVTHTKRIDRNSLRKETSFVCSTSSVLRKSSHMRQKKKLRTVAKIKTQDYKNWRLQNFFTNCNSSTKHSYNTVLSFTSHWSSGRPFVQRPQVLYKFSTIFYCKTCCTGYAKRKRGTSTVKLYFIDLHLPVYVSSM